MFAVFRHISHLWIILLKLWALPRKAKEMLKLGSLNNESLIVEFSGNQLTSIDEWWRNIPSAKLIYMVRISYYSFPSGRLFTSFNTIFLPYCNYAFPPAGKHKVKVSSDADIRVSLLLETSSFCWVRNCSPLYLIKYISNNTWRKWILLRWKRHMITFVYYLKHCMVIVLECRYRSVGIPTGYRLDGLSSIPGRVKKYFSSPHCPDRLWSPPSLLSKDYWKVFPWGWSGRSLKLTTHLRVVPRWRMVQLYLHSPCVFMAWCLIN
jgi:hypothetical protein